MKKKNKKNLTSVFVILFILVLMLVVYISLPFLSKLPNEKKVFDTTTSTIQVVLPIEGDPNKFQPSVVTLEIKSGRFNPDRVTLIKGSTATWINKDTVTHTVTSEGNFDSKDILPGKSWTYTFNTAGTFEYSCKYHPSMKATVVISE